MFFSPEEIAREDLAYARALGQVPEAVKLLPGRAFGGDTSMPADVHRDDEGEEAAPLRGTMRSPFV